MRLRSTNLVINKFDSVCYDIVRHYEIHNIDVF